MKLNVIRELLPGVNSPAERYFRMVNEGYAETIDDIGPSFLHGGRYNPRLEFGVLYLANEDECAFREKLRQVGGRKDNLLIQTVGSFSVRISKSLDLTDDRVLSALDVKAGDLVRDGDWAVPQQVAREARSVGFECIVAPSVVGRECRNLVVFKDKLSPPSYCTLETGSVRPYEME